MSIIRVFYTNHWPEVVPLMAECIGPGDVLVTEDAPSAEFGQMLAGSLSIDAYLLATDIEFPEFGRRMCRLWRRLYRSGIPVLPVEPFVETLLDIHTFFAEGGTPEAIAKDTTRGQVYRAEREASGALIDFYQASSSASFDVVLSATRHFARLDAQRFVLRDRLRAEAIVGLLKNHPRICVEAGQIHLALAWFLRQRLAPDVAVKPVFLMRAIVSRLGQKGHLFPPGDLLTLLYLFHPHRRDNPRHDLLAARALIYAKVAAKNETGPDAGGYRRTLDDLRTIDLVNRLSLRQCALVFKKVKRTVGADARGLLMAHLRGK